MKCPKCLKEINDNAAFCGYCGQVINKEPNQEVLVEENANKDPQIIQDSTENIIEGSKSNPAPKKQKKHIGLKILLVFSIISIIAGAVLGLLTARGIIDLSTIISTNSFEWTDFSKANEPESETETEPSDEKSKDEEYDSKTTTE